MGTHNNILASVMVLFLSALALSAGSAKAAEKPDADAPSAKTVETVVAQKEARAPQTARSKGDGYTPPKNGSPDNTQGSGSR